MSRLCIFFASVSSIGYCNAYSLPEFLRPAYWCNNAAAITTCDDIVASYAHRRISRYRRPAHIGGLEAIIYALKHPEDDSSNKRLNKGVDVFTDYAVGMQFTRDLSTIKDCVLDVELQRTIFMEMVRQGRLETLNKPICARFMEGQEYKHDTSGNNILHLAVMSGANEVVKYVLASFEHESGRLLSEKNNAGVEPVLIAMGRETSESEPISAMVRADIVTSLKNWKLAMTAETEFYNILENRQGNHGSPASSVREPASARSILSPNPNHFSQPPSLPPTLPHHLALNSPHSSRESVTSQEEARPHSPSNFAMPRSASNFAMPRSASNVVMPAQRENTFAEDLDDEATMKTKSTTSVENENHDSGMATPPEAGSLTRSVMAMFSPKK